MYVYEDQYGWALAPKTNSAVDYVRHRDAFSVTYKTRADAERLMSEIMAASCGRCNNDARNWPCVVCDR